MLLRFQIGKTGFANLVLYSGGEWWFLRLGISKY